ncbi:MAG: hypothetical protein O9284_12205 [Steroidobacteraceae bacterium]|nr:hypothetical protein [Steroidobacteraceae bacterium]
MLKHGQIVVASLVVALCGVVAPSAAQEGSGAPRPSSLGEVMLDNGLSLLDWINAVASRETSPSLATGGQAATYVRRYGAYRELLDVVHRASQRPELLAAPTNETAANQLQTLLTARRALGDWPDLVLATATARAVLGDAAGAVGELRRWMAVAPASAPLRTEVAQQLLAAESDPVPAVEWLQRTAMVELATRPRRPIPERLQPYLPELQKAARCVGLPASQDDYALRRKQVLRVGKDRHASDFTTRFRAVASGLVESGPVEWDGSASKYEYYDELSSTLGGVSAQRTRTSGEHWTETTRYYEAVECSGSVFPVKLGTPVEWASRGRVKMTFKWATDPSPNTRQSRIDSRVSITATSGPLTPEQIMALAPLVQIPSAALGRWKVYEGLVDSRSKFTAADGEVTEHSSKGRVALVEGPNVVLMIDKNSNENVESFEQILTPL